MTRFSPPKASGIPPTHFGMGLVCHQSVRVAGEGSAPLQEGPGQGDQGIPHKDNFFLWVW